MSLIFVYVSDEAICFSMFLYVSECFLYVSDEACGLLLASFQQELRLKQMILQEVGHTVTSDLCMVYLSCWLQQPFLPPQTRLTLEALLLETGHRPL